MELPAGVVTFLFTDVEGSTRLFQRFGDEFPTLLARHNAIIRDAIAGTGHEISTEGDAFFVAFADATDAVRAAIAAQRALGAADWPDDGAIRVRMGLHCGDAQPVGANYVALAVHQAARVAHAGHGGQIVVSEELMRCATGNDFAYKPLGAFLLKDFATVASLFQVSADGLGETFPPLRTPSATTNLPRPRTEFVGREKELAQLAELVDRSQLVTLTGTGGTGKTRLSIELARQVASQFDNGVAWVDLASRNDPALVAQAVAESLGIGEQADRILVHTIVDHLCTTRTLVVIDNCEHLVEATAEVVEHLLDGCERIVVVATSREPLGVPGEAIFRVPSLAVDGDAPAVALFVDRVRNANPDFVLDAAARSAIETICARLDGIPLAIELAASRARGMAIGDLAARIEDRFALLSGGARTAMPRQQTLRGLVDWSYELLDETDRAVFRRISVFNGRFPLAGVEAVCADVDVDVLDAMARLVDKSLVNMLEGEVSAYQLLQTIRHYGFERLLDAGEAPDARTRHSEWCTSTVLRIATDDSDEAASAAQFETMIDDVRATFEWCIARGQHDDAANLVIYTEWFMLRSGLFTEMRHQLDVILRDGTFSSATEAYLYHLLQLVTWEQGDFEAAVHYARECLARDIEGIDDKPWFRRHLILNNLGAGLWRIGDLEEAERSYRLCYDTGFAAEGDILPLHNIGLVNMSRGDFTAARRSFEEARRLATNAFDEMLCVMRLGETALAEDDLALARALFDEAAGLATDLERHPLISSGEGEVEACEGNYDAAIAKHNETMAVYRMHGNTNGVAHEELAIARVERQRGRFDEARRLVDLADAVFEQQGDISHLADVRIELARLAEHGGDPGVTCNRWQDAVHASRRARDPLRLARTLVEASRAAVAAKNTQLARAFLTESTEICEERSSYPRCQKLLAEITEISEGIVGPAAV